MDNPAHLLVSLAEHDQRIYFAFNINKNRFVYLSPAFYSFTKLTPDQISPQDLFSLVHEDDRKLLIAIYAGLKPARFKTGVEFRVIWHDDEEYTFRLNMLIEDQQNKERILIGTLDDISAIKAHEKNVNDMSNKKNAILNILSHDLAGPLGSIQHFTYLLNKKIGNSYGESIHTMISSIETISKRCIVMIQDFIQLEFIESVGVDVIKKRTNLIEVLKPFFVEYQDSQDQTCKTFNFRPDNQDIYVKIDENKFLQVINNLISNSIKFTPDHGVITLSIEEKEKVVLITLEDNGIGIPEKFHANLFDKFSEARRTGLRGEPSVGLGMSIIKTIIDWHRGKIWFESTENVGTTFYIELKKSN